MQSLQLAGGPASTWHTAWGADNGGFANRTPRPPPLMARWPRHVWTSIFTYGVIFLLFPALCLLAYAWVQQWIF